MRIVMAIIVAAAAGTSAFADDAAPPPPGPTSDEDAVRTLAETSVRAEPAGDAPAIFTVPADTDLTWVVQMKKNGFFRVIRRDKGPQGWAAAADVAVTHQHEHGEKPEAKVCAASLDECPAHGCDAEGSPEGRDNEMKRTWPPQVDPVTLSFADFAGLQRLADEKVGEGPNDLTPEQRAKLQHLPCSVGSVSEGDRVRAIGYISKSNEGLHVNKSGEPVNCNLKDPKDNDFHIPLVAKPDDSEFQGIVVEMIPQKRPSNWTIDALKEIQKSGAQVLVEGGLSYDKVHYVNADPDNPFKDEPERMSLWEIHPITALLVCRKDQCDPQNAGDWSELGSQ